MTAILNNPQQLNLFISLLLVLIALIAIRWSRKWKKQATYSFFRHGLYLWTAKWCVFLVTWILIFFNMDNRLILMSSDLNSLIAFGFVTALRDGDSYKAPKTARSCLFLLVLLLSWNLITYGTVNEKQTWYLPSVVISLVTLLGSGIVVLKRYWNLRAFLLFLVVVVYAALQQPAYEAQYLGKGAADQYLLKILAFTKLLYFGLFYFAFSSKLSTFGPIRLLELPVLREPFRTIAKAIILGIVGALGQKAALWFVPRFIHLDLDHQVSLGIGFFAVVVVMMFILGDKLREPAPESRPNASTAKAIAAVGGGSGRRNKR